MATGVRQSRLPEASLTPIELPESKPPRRGRALWSLRRSQSQPALATTAEHRGEPDAQQHTQHDQDHNDDQDCVAGFAHHTTGFQVTDGTQTPAATRTPHPWPRPATLLRARAGQIVAGSAPRVHHRGRSAVAGRLADLLGGTVLLLANPTLSRAAVLVSGQPRTEGAL